MKSLFAAVLFAMSSSAIASLAMPVIFSGDYPVVAFEDTVMKDSIVCRDKDAVIQYTRSAGNNKTAEFKRLVTNAVTDKKCIILDVDTPVTVDAMVPIPTNNGVLFAVRVSGMFWTSANYLPASRELTIKWTRQVGYGD